MSIEMPRGLPFSVDTFGPYTATKTRKRHHFLTHAHKDHTVGISPSNIVFPIYSSPLTISLLLQRHPQLDESFFVRIEIGQSVIVDDPDGEFQVTAFDANHCPGAVMFLFEGSFGNILHTGDCRLTRDCLESLPDKYVGRQGNAPKCSLDYIFLDCTFGKSPQKFPSKHSAIRQIINCIWNHPDAPVVYLACDMLGQEDVLLQVSRTFGSKIYVDKATNLECFRSLMVIVPEIVSEDSSSRFQIFSGFPKLFERASAKLAEARSKLQSEPLIIRPSAQWYVCDDGDEDYSQSGTQMQKQRKVRFSEAVKDEFGIWHVCYSMHSSREELESAMQLLSPKWVVSTVPSCRAMELNYVKKNCFISRFSPDDPFWKLLDIDMEVSPVASTHTHTVTLSCCLMSEGLALDSTSSKMEPVIESSSIKKQILSLSPEKSLPVTLFGRARLSSQVSERKAIHTQCVYTKTSPELEILNVEEVVESLQDDTIEESVDKESCRSLSSASSKETCKDLSGDLIKLYRSMHAPVPRPLPSLMELMNARKRSRNHLKSRASQNTR
uniref:5' exonuclease Apollo n=1 Tax=Noccaea caerulescens TaxID=107243 RepID=A0A1J3FJV4_NOCCA